MEFFHITDFTSAFQWVISHGYFLMFLATLIEGPIITAAASFALALGYFSIWPIFIISILGDIIADIIYYLIGYLGKLKVAEDFGHWTGLSENRIKKIERLINKHPLKTLIVLKMTPVLPTPGLMIIGATKMHLNKFITICVAIILPKVVFFMTIGYFFGSVYDTALKQFEKGFLILILIAILLYAIYYGFNKLSARIARNIEKI